MARLPLLAIAALAVLPLTAGTAQAQRYDSSSRYEPTNRAYEQCVREQRQRQVAGAVVGGLIGAVIGAELHDEAQDDNRRDRARERRYRDRDGYRERRRDRRDRRRHRRDRHYEEDGNDGAVLAGGALGAVAGAAVAGGQDCRRFLNERQSGYSDGYDTGYREDYRQSSGYDDGYYRGDREVNYDDAQPYQPYTVGNDEELAGGPSYPRETRTVRSQSRTRSTAPRSGQPCRTMQSGNGARVLMCQGTDGIWRPADVR